MTTTLQTLATLYELDRRARAAGADGWWPDAVKLYDIPKYQVYYQWEHRFPTKIKPDHALTLVTEEAEQWLSDRDWCLSTLEPGLISRDAWTLKVANLLTIEVEAIEKDSNKENDDG